MRLIKNFITKITKKRTNEPWLSYYSKEEQKIEFTNKTIYEYLKSCVGEDRDYIALNYFGKRISYNEFFDKIDQVSRALRNLGVKPKDVVTICMPNTPEAVITFYACNKIGAIADMIHPLSASEEIKYYLQQSESKLLILIDIDYQKVKPILNETNVKKTVVVSVKESMPVITSFGYQVTRGYKVKAPHISNGKFITWKEFMLRGLAPVRKSLHVARSSDVALILHSGGTTGKPKGIMISNYNFNAEAQQGAVNVYNVRPKDKIMTILPVFHGFGLGVCVHCPLCLKVETILVPEFDGKRFHRMMKNDKPNVIAGVPTLWEAMMDNKKFDNVDLSCLKYVISGGDYLTIPMENRMNKFLRSHGANISISKGYGMTESVAATAYTFDGANEPGSIGIPMVGNEFCVCNPDTGEVLPFGEEGELCVCGPTVMVGYLNNKEETKKVLKKHDDGKIWLHTGDFGYIALNGVIYFTGRLKRVIVSSGFNIYPSQIEEVIERHPLVNKCCVISIPHPYKIHAAKAIIVLKEGEKPSSKIKLELKKLCKENLAAYSLPKEYEFRDSLPKTLYNKVDYKELEREENEKITA